MFAAFGCYKDADLDYFKIIWITIGAYVFCIFNLGSTVSFNVIILGFSIMIYLSTKEEFEKGITI